MMTDPIADLLTRIRNAQQAKHSEVNAPYSTLKEAIVRVLKEGGFISDFQVAGEGIKKAIVIFLKYAPDGQSIIEEIQRVSRPGRRIFSSYENLTPLRNGLGVTIISTSKGVLSDQQARDQKVGGELLLRIW